VPELRRFATFGGAVAGAFAALRRRKLRAGWAQQSGVSSVSRRAVAAVDPGLEASSVGGSQVDTPELETDEAGVTRLKYQEEGWSKWTWQPEGVPIGPFECHYVAAGPEGAPAVVLVHGFGASSYHWRYQVPALAAQGFRVYSLCLLGYGWSPRVVLRYTGEFWASQINTFLRDVVQAPAVLVGNSVGGFTSLLAAALDPERCKGLVLLNAAGRFEARQPGVRPAQNQMGDVLADAAETADPGPIQWALQQLTRVVAGWAFYTTKLRIQPILEWVYVNGTQVDDDLVTSIRAPADHPDALDTFGEVIQMGRRTDITVFDALDQLPSRMPILLLWGMQDPWMRPARAEAICVECDERGLDYQYVQIDDAGHCPQDDTPVRVNEALVEWLDARGHSNMAARKAAEQPQVA